MMKKLLHYETLHLIGRGGMGDVYAAEDTKLDRRVALKVLPSEMAADPERRARFEREAKAVAALNHPSIVTIHSVEEAEGIHFITMELVEGKTLSELIPKGGCQLSWLLDRAVAMTDAVSAAHTRGITHRDLKPDNVMVTDDGRVKVLDFGLAKLRADDTNDAAATRVAEDAQTAEGKILGTVAYMSPEQAEGKPVDPRSDVFSLGIILYEMATGRRPFEGDTPVSTLSSILKDTPSSVTDLNKALPRHLGRIVRRCLSKDPNRRYQTAVDLRNDLEGLRDEIESGELLLEGASPGARAGRLSGRRLAVGLAVLVVAAIGIGYGFYRLVGVGADAPVTSTAFQQMEMTRLTGKGGFLSPVISPDGRYVVYVQDDDEGDSLWLLQTATASRVQIVPPSDASLSGPAFSPDGDLIYYVSKVSGAAFGTLYRIPVLGGPSRRILANVRGRISFSPDGEQFVFRRSEGDQRDLLLVADVDGGNEREIARRDSPKEYHGDPAWSPDGRVIAVAGLTRSDSSEFSLLEVPSGGGEERTISGREWGHSEDPAWLPDGSGLVVSESWQLWEQPYPEGPARRITNDLNAWFGVSLTADGRSLVAQLTETDRALWVTSVEEDAAPERITSGDSRIYSAGVSCAPDGRIVYGASIGQASGLWITGENGGREVQLTSGDWDTDPSISADGRFVVYASSDSTGSHIRRTELEGGIPVQLTYGAGEHEPRCHPDGRWVLYLGVADGGYTLNRVPIEGGESEPLSDRVLTGSPPAISPDGTRVAFIYDDEGTDRTLADVLRIEGGGLLQTLELSESGSRESLRWSPDGDALDYIGYRNVWSQPLDGGPARQLTHFETEYLDDFTWAKDGKTLAVLRATTTWSVVLLTNFR